MIPEYDYIDTEEKMTDKITVVLTPSMKEEFYKKCEDSSINPSQLIRNWIDRFCTNT